MMVMASGARHWWYVTLAAAAILMVTMGVRQSMGLFIMPLQAATAIDIVSISFALAIGQLLWGVAQPIAGAIADQYGSGRVLVAGIVLMALGLLATAFAQSALMLTLALGVLMSAGSGAGSFSVLIGAASHQLPAEKRGMASGVINAGGSFGQFLFAPITQGLIHLVGWIGALVTLATTTLAALLLVRPLKTDNTVLTNKKASTTSSEGMRSTVERALSDRSYLLLHLGFFTCGFHIAFLVTHLPGEIQLCGLPTIVASTTLAIIGLANVAGSLLAGWAIQHVRCKWVLFWMYGSRAALILVYLAAPKTAMVFYVFAAALGLTWLATVPPTASLIAKLFGPRYLATLFGLTLVSHQIGGFFGAWLGGVALVNLGSFQMMWWADIGLAAVAAIIHLPIREAPIQLVRHT